MNTKPLDTSGIKGFHRLPKSTNARLRSTHGQVRCQVQQFIPGKNTRYGEKGSDLHASHRYSMPNREAQEKPYKLTDRKQPSTWR